MIVPNISNTRETIKIYFWMVIFPSIVAILIVLCQFNNPITVVLATYVFAYTINVWVKAIIEVKRAKKNPYNYKKNECTEE